MEKHHQDSINKFLKIYKKDQSILAILLSGSIAHSFAKADSDIDIVLVVSSNEYIKRKNAINLAFSLWDICDYKGGYIDCKVVDLHFLEKVAARGSDPARYAFMHNKILFSRIENLNEILTNISKYPVNEVDERRKRFASQLLAWKWYYSEAVKKGNKYLVFLSIQKIVLFGCRIILNENELLFPYHKWMLKVVEKSRRKPLRLMEKINLLLENHSLEKVNEFCEEILKFINYNDKSVDWPNYFLRDSEQNWINYEPPVDDI